MTIGQKGIDLIKHFEGCKLTAYLCPAKVWTIGWGATQQVDGRSVRQGDTITQAEADKLLIDKLNMVYAPGVQRLIRPSIQLTQNQFDALVSFAYNCGIGALQKSSLLSKVNSNPLDSSIRDSFAAWNKGGGKVLKGLVLRRTAESDLYFS